MTKISPNWASMSSPSQEVMVEKPQTQEQVQTQDVVQETTLAQEQTQQPVAEQTVKAETTVSEQTPQAEQTTPETTEQAQQQDTVDDFKLTVEHIKDAPVVYPKESLQALAQEIGIPLEKESREDLVKHIKENFVPKSEYEKLNIETEEKAYSRLKPEVAAMLKFRQMLPPNIPDEVIFNPTGRTDWMLSMSDEQLVRQSMVDMIDEAGNPLYDEETINTEMELLTNQNLVPHKAKMLKTDLVLSRQKILDARSNIFNHYEQQAKQVEVERKTEVNTQIKNAMNNVSAFMGVPLSNEIKQTLLAKYDKGAYDSVLNNANNMVSAILQLEFGDTFAKQIASKVKADTKREFVEKHSDVPSKQQQPGSRVNVVTNDGQDNWAAFKKT